MGVKNDSLVDQWLEDDNLMLIECWARDGCTMSDIANRIGISRSTLTTWRNKYKEIDKAIKTGKEIVDYKVENALLKSALGYTTKEIKVTLGKRIINGQTIQITKEVTTKEVAPNVSACMAWLCNRMPDKWKRNRIEKEIIEDEENDVQITILRGSKNELEDNVNSEIKIEKNVEEQQKTAETDKKGATLKQEDDLDYWPEDWEDDNE